MSEEKLVPKLRFLEFTDEWSEHKFENIFDIKNGLNKGKDYFGEGIRILNYMDVNKYELNTENTIKGLVELTDDEIERYSVKPNDLFFTRTSETSEEIGLTSAYMGNTIKCVFSGFLLRARPKIDLNSLFFAYYLRSPRQRNNIIKFSSITTRALISGGNLSKMKIKYPSIEEQNKIANLFLILDKKVELLEKKYREYQCFKKYLMQKLFAQELRFDFDDEWEFKKLGYISVVKDGTHDSPKHVDNGYPLITSKNLIGNGLDFENVNYISNEDYDIINKRSNVDKGDILFGMIGTIGNPVIVETDDFAIKNVALIKEKTELLNNFLIYVLNTDLIRKQFYRLNAGGTQKFIALGLIKELSVPVPSIKEQKEISEFLSLVDNNLDNYRKQLHEINTFKKGLLQQMFV